MDRFPRVQEVILPILRDALPGVQITSWIPDVDHRVYPMINIRRLGGVRDRKNPEQLDHPMIEMTAYGTDGLPETEELYTRALDAILHAKETQKVSENGYLSYVREIMGQTQFSSLFVDSWRVQGIIQLGVRAPRKD